MINKVILLGNLGKEPDFKTGSNGNNVCNFSLATTSSRKVGDEWKEETEWHTCVCFGKTADNVMKYLTKGSKVYIEGKLKTDKYTDKNGVEKYATKIIINEIKFLSKVNKDQSEELQQAPTMQQAETLNYDDDIPF
jgi:single-strand DNA-binding protein